MKIFNYDRKTNEFTSCSEARLDPMETALRKENVFLLPACATFEEPPATGENEKAVFQNGKWSVVPDYRGETFFRIDTKEEVKIAELGVAPDGNLTESRPGKTSKWDETKEEWIDDIDALKTEKTERLKAALIQLITERYDLYTQASLQFLLMTPNSSADIKADAVNVLEWIQSVLDDYYSIKGSIESMTTMDEISAFEWDTVRHVDSAPEITLRSIMTKKGGMAK